MIKKKDLHKLFKENLKKDAPSNQVLDEAKFVMQNRVKTKDINLDRESKIYSIKKQVYKRKNLRKILEIKQNFYKPKNSILNSAKEQISNLETQKIYKESNIKQRKWLYALAPLLVVVIISAVIFPQIFNNSLQPPPSDGDDSNINKSLVAFSQMYITSGNDYKNKQVDLYSLFDDEKISNTSLPQYRSYYKTDNKVLLFTSGKINVVNIKDNNYIDEVILSACYYANEYQILSHRVFKESLKKTTTLRLPIVYEGAISYEDFSINYNNFLEQGERYSKFYFSIFDVEYYLTITGSESSPNAGFEYAEKLISDFLMKMLDKILE